MAAKEKWSRSEETHCTHKLNTVLFWLAKGDKHYDMIQKPIAAFKTDIMIFYLINMKIIIDIDWYNQFCQNNIFDYIIQPQDQGICRGVELAAFFGLAHCFSNCRPSSWCWLAGIVKSNLASAVAVAGASTITKDFRKHSSYQIMKYGYFWQGHKETYMQRLQMVHNNNLGFYRNVKSSKE